MTNLISIDSLTLADIKDIIQQAKQAEHIVHSGKRLSLLTGKILANIFYEPSSRTSSSFHAAMLHLGGQVISIASNTSSIAKGETLEDTIRTMATYADVIVLRHSEIGAAKRAALCSPVPILNAGDGIGEHPSQALLDLYTIESEVADRSKAVITMVGDLQNGRTVHSLTKILNVVGAAHINFISPDSLQMPKEILSKLKIPFTTGSDLTSVLPSTDVLYVTRVQKERFESLAEYDRVKNSFIIEPKILTQAKTNMIIMHPLPRTSEISPEIDTDPRAAYFRQMKNGVYIRMALLARACNTKIP